MVFYMDGCPACIRATPNVKKAAELLQAKGFKVVAFNIREGRAPSFVKFAPTIVAVDAEGDTHSLPTNSADGTEDRSVQALVKLAETHLVSSNSLEGGVRRSTATLAEEVFDMLGLSGGLGHDDSPQLTATERRAKKAEWYEEAERRVAAAEINRNRRLAADLTTKLRFLVARARAEGATKEEIRKLSESSNLEPFLSPDTVPAAEVERLTKVGREEFRKLVEEVANTKPSEARSEVSSMEAVLALRSAVDAQIAHQAKLLEDPMQARKAERRMAELNELSFLAAPRTREEAELLGALVRALARGRADSAHDLHTAILRYRNANLRADADDATNERLREAAIEALAASKMLAPEPEPATAAAAAAEPAAAEEAGAEAAALPAAAAALAALDTPVPKIGKDAALAAAAEFLRQSRSTSAE